MLTPFIGEGYTKQLFSGQQFHILSGPFLRPNSIPNLPKTHIRHSSDSILDH